MTYCTEGLRCCPDHPDCVHHQRTGVDQVTPTSVYVTPDGTVYSEACGMSTRTDSDRLRLRNKMLADPDLGLNAAMSTAISHVLLPVLQELQAEVWQESHDVLCDFGPGCSHHQNPYRKG